VALRCGLSLCGALPLRERADALRVRSCDAFIAKQIRDASLKLFAFGLKWCVWLELNR